MYESLLDFVTGLLKYCNKTDEADIQNVHNVEVENNFCYANKQMHIG